MKKLLEIGLSILLATLAPLLGAAPVGYSINSDSADGNADSLYRIDLGLGVETRVGAVLVGSDARIDRAGAGFTSEYEQIASWGYNIYILWRDDRNAPVDNLILARDRSIW